MKKARRPWGTYEILAKGLGYKVKRITVHPSHRLSYQRHRFRKEFWTIVKGKADVVLDGKKLSLIRGQTLIVEREAWHRIGCRGRKPLIFIEVQTGNYLGEDDIQRLGDDYGRGAP